MAEDDAPSPDLTTEQLRALDLVARGWTDDRIARDLGVSTRTVRRRLAQARRALGTKSRVAAAVAAARMGLIGSVSASGHEQSEDIPPQSRTNQGGGMDREEPGGRRG